MQPKHRKLNNLKFLNTFNAKNQNALKLKALSKKNRIYLKANTRGVLNNFNYLKPRLTLYLFSILYVKSLKTSLKAKKHITLINYFYPSLNSFFKNSWFYKNNYQTLDHFLNLLNYGFTQFFRQRALEKKIGVANLRKKKLITVNKLAANKSLIANAYYLRKGVAQKSCKFITKLTPLKVIHYNKYNSFPLKPVYITKQHLLFSRKNFTVKSLFLAKIAIIFKNFYQKFLKNTVNQLLRIKTKNFFNLYLLFVSANLGDYSNTNFVINHESRSLNESTKKTFTLYALHKVDLVAFKVLNFSNLNYIFNKSSSNYFNDSHSTKKKQNEMFFYKNLSFYHATALSLISLYLGDYNSTSTGSIQQLNQKTSRSLTTNYTTPQHFFKKRRVYRHSLSKLPTSSTAIYLNSNFEYLVNFLTSPVTFKYLFFCKLNQQFRVSTTAFFNSISCFRLYSKLNIFNKTNLLNKQNFSLKIYKKIIKISADKKFRLSTPATTLFSITNFLEHCSGKCVIINFNPFLLQFLTFVEVAQCYLWSKNLIYFRKILGPHLFIVESLKIIYISLKLKDPSFLINWITRMLDKISFYKFKFFLRYIKYVVRVFFLSRFNELDFLGIKMQLKGKVSVAGNARTRTVLQTVGKVGQSTFNNKVLYDMRTIWTFTGAISLRLWFYF